MSPPDLERPAWHLERLGAVTGRGVRVAVVDSGLDPRSQDAARTPSASGVALERRADGTIARSADVRDRLGHGTACAAVIRCLAPSATLVPVRVFGERLETSPEVLVAALDWCAERAIDVVNLSLGTTVEAFFEPLRDACRRAADAGCLIVTARPRGAGPTAPADFPEALSATFADFESAWDLDALEHGEADFVLPGTHTVRRRGAETLLRGSSLAAPHLAAHVALLRERFPGVPLEDVRRLLDELARAGPAAPS